MIIIIIVVIVILVIIVVIVIWVNVAAGRCGRRTEGEAGDCNA